MQVGVWVVAVILAALLAAGWGRHRRRAGKSGGPQRAELAVLLGNARRLDAAQLAGLLGAAAEPPVEVPVVLYSTSLPSPALAGGAEWFEARIGEVFYSGSILEASSVPTLTIAALGPAGALPGCYRTIARVLAGLWGEEFRVLVHPPTLRVAKCDPAETRGLLLTEDPVAAIFGVPPEAKTAEEDPRIEEARAEARRRIGEFVALVAEGGEGRFAIAAREGSGSGWLTVEGWDGERFAARRASGEAVGVAVGAVEDWMAVRDGVTTGGFTIAARRRILEADPPAAWVF